MMTMRFLADMGISQKASVWLRSRGHDCVHLRDEGLQTLPDELVLQKAKNENRIILTFDLDFAALIAVSNASAPSVIILRLKNQTPDNQINKINHVLAKAPASLLKGAIVSVDETSFRIKHLPVQNIT